MIPPSSGLCASGSPLPCTCPAYALLSIITADWLLINWLVCTPVTLPPFFSFLASIGTFVTHTCLGLGERTRVKVCRDILTSLFAPAGRLEGKASVLDAFPLGQRGASSWTQL